MEFQPSLEDAPPRIPSPMSVNARMNGMNHLLIHHLMIHQFMMMGYIAHTRTVRIGPITPREKPRLLAPEQPRLLDRPLIRGREN